MGSLLIVLIYISFVSLGLPDSILGSAWPVMQPNLGVPLSYAGIISMIISVGTIVSSLLSDRLNKKLGTGLVTAISTAMTALALLGFSLSRSYWLLCVIAVPYGLGAGAVDAALNNYVALHYKARHMSWLHAMWGIGATAGPVIMGQFLAAGNNWPGGYRAISFVQAGLAVLLFCSLPLWRRKTESDEEAVVREPIPLRKVLKIPGVPFVMLAFLGYCAFEQTCGLWAASYLFTVKGLSADAAATCGAAYFFGITGGRFLSGFITEKVGDRRMIRFGAIIAAIGIILVVLPIHSFILSVAGLIIAGLGCAPVYPSIIHSTPKNFGPENSQAVIGVQMASAYVGSCLAPALFGVLAQAISLTLYPFYLLFFAVLLLSMTELLNRLKDRSANTENTV